MPEIFTKKLLVTKQQFTSHNPKPQDGKGFVNFHFEDNRKDCLCETKDSVCWQATLTVKAFSSTNDKHDPATDILLMEATANVEGEFTIEPLNPDTDLQSLAWYFDETCKQKLLNKMRLLLLHTEFSQIPLPNNA
jgi:hypothetical protein